MRVLFTNHGMDMRAGTELYVRDVACALQDRGHWPVVYSPHLGDVAEELRAATIPVVDDLGRLGEPPDLIHGQHHLEAVTAMLHFPGVPAVYACHGWLPWVERPPVLPRILRWIAVDETVRDRLVLESGVPPERVELLLNFVDLDRYAPRAPLPERPARALVFSNLADASSHLPAVQEACAAAGMSVEVIGKRAGRVARRPDRELGRYDLVFAKGRAALEALAVGCAVVLCDRVGSGPMVTRAELDVLRRRNFGVRALRRPVTAAALSEQIARYDARDAAEVARAVRAGCSRHDAVEQLLGLYRDVLEEAAATPPPDPAVEGRAFAAYLREASSAIKAAHGRRAQRPGLLRRLRAAKAQGA